jgi:anti-anti-sigma factor
MVQTATVSLETTARDAEILTLDGQFDSSNAAEFERRIADALRAGAPLVVIDLRGVSFIDSTMIQALVNAHRTAEAQAGPGSLCLVRPNPVVWNVCVLCGLGALFPAFPTLSDALLASAPRT